MPNSLLLNFLINSKRIKLVRNLEKDSLTTDVSIVIPVHNQEQRIIGNLESVLRNSKLNFEIILINDKSTDNTHAKILEFLDRNLLEMYPNCIRFKYFKSSIPIYETKCDEFGIIQSSSELIIEIQADMEILETSFDTRLVNAINSDSNLLAISARATHHFHELSTDFLEKQSADKVLLKEIILNYIDQIKAIIYLVKSHKMGTIHDQGISVMGAPVPKVDEFFYSRGSAGWIGELIDGIPKNPEEFRKIVGIHNFSKIWIGSSVIRGPLIIRKSLYSQLGGFNTSAYFLGNDDHDLCLRGGNFGFKVGFLPVHFVAPLKFGSERSRKTLTNLIWREIHRYARRKNLANSELFKALSSGSSFKANKLQAEIIDIE